MCKKTLTPTDGLFLKNPYDLSVLKRMHENLKMSAYTQGLEAAHSGKMVADCPYEYNTPEGQKWLNGYQDGGGEE
jgi:ribosome modulation factor